VSEPQPLKCQCGTLINRRAATGEWIVCPIPRGRPCLGHGAVMSEKQPQISDSPPPEPEPEPLTLSDGSQVDPNVNPWD